jgi:hypothetical protein
MDASETPDEVWVWNWITNEATMLSVTAEWMQTLRLYLDNRTKIYFFNTDHKVGSLLGAGAQAVITSGDIEGNPGVRSTCVRARPLIQRPGAISATLRVGTRGRLEDTISWSSAKSITTEGEFNCREDGRYHRFELTIAASSNWDTVTGLDVDFVPSGNR